MENMYIKLNNFILSFPRTKLLTPLNLSWNQISRDPQKGPGDLDLPRRSLMPGKVSVVPLGDILVPLPDWLLHTSLCYIKCTEGFSRTVNEIKEK